MVATTAVICGVAKGVVVAKGKIVEYQQKSKKDYAYYSYITTFFSI